MLHDHVIEKYIRLVPLLRKVSGYCDTINTLNGFGEMGNFIFAQTVTQEIG
jgi:hypothetical protein